ncbi:unnamed protein product [Pleuronectes platessa]|uniref:Uncharacterized protein n=1 Tax=Pleuronectes platessa TaxID=8262 RepID=A0A9N7V1I4_PLEPL|nr:unnamed protein product [Pleuronectes platessa]
MRTYLGVLPIIHSSAFTYTSMFFTPLFSSSCVPSVVIFMLSVIVCFLPQGRAQHTPSRRQLGPSHPKLKPNTCQTAERQTASPVSCDRRGPGLNPPAGAYYTIV